MFLKYFIDKWSQARGNKYLHILVNYFYLILFQSRLDIDNVFFVNVNAFKLKTEI